MSAMNIPSPDGNAWIANAIPQFSGPIDTPMIHRLSAPQDKRTQEEKASAYKELAIKRLGKPEEVAKLIAFLLSDESSYITGSVLSIDGGWMA